MKTLTVPGKKGPLELLVYGQRGALAITREVPPRGKWDRERRLTHLPTGYAILTADTLPLARYILRELVALPVAWETLTTVEELYYVAEIHRPALTRLRDIGRGKEMAL